MNKTWMLIKEDKKNIGILMWKIYHNNKFLIALNPILILDAMEDNQKELMTILEIKV